jgi:hypothetical protein
VEMRLMSAAVVAVRSQLASTRTATVIGRWLRG